MAAFINVKTGSNAVRNGYKAIPNTTTIRQALEDGGIDITRGVTHLDGAPLGAGELNKTFEDLGYDGTPGKDKAFLLNVVKADNA